MEKEKSLEPALRGNVRLTVRLPYGVYLMLVFKANEQGLTSNALLGQLASFFKEGQSDLDKELIMGQASSYWESRRKEKAK